MHNFINLRSKFFNELGRKIVHVTVCFTSYFIGSRLDLIGLFTIFCVVLAGSFLAETFGLLRFFNDVKRKSYGHYFMAIGVLITLIIYRVYGSFLPGNHLALLFAFLALGVADVLAVLGKPLQELLIQKLNWNKLKDFVFGGKTLMGSLIFFGTSLCLCLVLIFFSPILTTNLFTFPIWNGAKLLLFLLLLTLVERYSLLGFDNIFIPVLGYLGFWVSLLL